MSAKKLLALWGLKWKRCRQRKHKGGYPVYTPLAFDLVR